MQHYRKIHRAANVGSYQHVFIMREIDVRLEKNITITRTT